MRLSIAHHTTYRFTEPQARLVQMLRLKPGDSDQQAVVDWRIDVDCDARLREGRDGFGNVVTMLYASGPLDGIEIAVRGEVLTQPAPDGRVSGTSETLPPAVFRRQTGLTEPGDALAGLCDATGDARAFALDLSAALGTRIACVAEMPEAGLSARDAFARDAVTNRDMAHMLIGAARAAGFPARYVSGHHLPGRDEGSPATAHAWVELFDGATWFGVDPCHGALVDDSYVRVATGLDHSQAAPVAGSRLGFGEEKLDVAVSVEPLGRED